MKDIKYSKRQLDILKILGEQTFSEKILSKMYLGAIMVKDYNENPEAIYQAAHSLRELTWYMTDHLKQRGIKDHKDQLKTFIKEFDTLGGVQEKAIINQWHDLHQYFVKLCHHHDDISNPKYFEEKLYQLENIILSIHGPIYESISELDKILEIENPTLDNLEMALSLIKNLSSYEYFFRNLKYSNWLELLDKKGLYNNTPRFGERSIEPLFLLKIAKDKPDKVLEIIKRHSTTDHPGARFNFIKCLTQMPHNHIIQMIKPIKKWVNSQKEYTSSLYYSLTELVLKIIEKNGEVELFNLLKSMYAVKKEILENDLRLNEILEKRWEKHSRENYEVNELYQEDLPGEFQEENQSYLYEELVKKVLPDLMQKYPLKSLDLFSTLLRFSINFFLKDNNYNLVEDLSLSWRKFLEKKPIGRNFRNVLVDVLRDIIFYVGNNKQEKFSEIIKELKKYHYLIFRRLEFMSYYNFPELSIEFIKNLEISHELFKNIDENYEFFHFFKIFFDKLPKSTQDNYLKFIIKGAKKERKKWKKRKWKNFRWTKVYPELTKDKIHKFVKNWQKRKLKAIKDFIDQDFFDDLYIKTEEIDKVILFKDNGVIFGDKSPISQEMIEKMSIDKLIHYLLEFDNKNQFIFSKIGLGRELELNIPKRPNDYIEMLKNALEKNTLHKYISYIISGLNSALKSEQELNLEELFLIFEKILSNEIVIDNEPIFLKEDNDRDIKKSIADFILKNLKIERISIKFKKTIWNLIIKLLGKREISIEKELYNIQQNWMPREMRLNSIHGVTIEAIFKYISWVIESEPEKFEDEMKKLSKFIPEVIEIFDNLLSDSLYTTKYIFGFNLNYLIYLETEWIRKNIDILLPRDNERLDYFESTWAGFLDDNRIITHSFEILRPFFLFALKKINENKKLISFSRHTFVKQIVVLYIHGMESLEDDDSLITLFFHTAGELYRKIFIREIGNRLKQYQNEENSEEIKNCLRVLLENRLEEIKLGQVKDFLEELYGFTYWFRNSIFDKRWMIDKFIEILKLLGDSLKESWTILDSLIDYLDDHPEQVIDIIEKVIKNEIKNNLLLFEDKYKKILKILLLSKNEDVKRRAKDLVNFLLKMNIHSFKDLLIGIQ